MFILKNYIHSTWNDVVYWAVFPVTTTTTTSIKIDFWMMVRMALKKSQVSTSQGRGSGERRALLHSGGCRRYRLVILNLARNPQSNYVGEAESMRSCSKSDTYMSHNSVRTTL